jgi:hypothetical protein
MYNEGLLGEFSLVEVINGRLTLLGAVLNNVIPTEILDKLNVQMCKETEDLLSRPTTHFK